MPLQIALIDSTIQVDQPIQVSSGEIQRIAGQSSNHYQLAMTEQELDSVVLYQQGNTLALEYDGEFILAIDGFFNPDTNIALSLGATLQFNAESPVIDDGGVIWRREDDSMPVAFWVGTGAAVVGAAAGGGGGGGGGSGGGTVLPPVDTTAPVFSSGATADTLPEHSGANIVIYQAVASDTNPIVFSISGPDSALFTIDTATGEVTLTIDAEFDDQQFYNFTVTATDSAGNSSNLAVTLPISEVIDNSAPVITSPATAVVAEGSDLLYTLTATDGDSDTLTYSFVGEVPAGLAIDPATGAVTLTDSLTGDEPASYTFTVQVSDGTNPPISQTVTVNVDDAPVLAPSATVSVHEGLSQLYTAVANDSDSATLIYGFAGDTPAGLAINATTGVVTLTGGALTDKSATASYSFTVQVSDATNTPVTQTVTVNVNAAPVITSPTAANVDESAAADTLIYTASASDEESDPVTYSLADGGDANLLAIDASSGAVTIDAGLNFITHPSLTFTVVATSAGQSDSQAVTITVDDVDVAPVFSSGSTAEVAENSPTDTVVYRAVASDRDGDPVSYSLRPEDLATFSIDEISGEVRLLASADLETLASYSFVVTASSTAPGAATQTSERPVTLAVINVDEVPVFSEALTGTSSLDENISGAAIYTAVATDPEGEAVVYSLTEGGDNDLFAIDSTTGVVTLVGSADYENQSSYTIEIIATAGGGSASHTLSVGVNNVDDAPRFISGATASVDENSSPDLVVYTAVATDDDGDSVSYAIGGTHADKFSIDGESGEVRLLAAADAETLASYSFIVTASSTAPGEDALTTDQPVTLTVTNLDEGPVFTSGAGGSVDENAAPGSVAYDAAAFDPEGDDVIYSLEVGGENDLFSIDPESGVVTLDGSADHESDDAYAITVIATSGGKSSSHNVAVAVVDVDEAPVFTSGSSASVAENSSVDTVVYRAAATDDDGDTVTYTLREEDLTRFSINASTGEVRLRVSADVETLALYSFEVTATSTHVGGTAKTATQPVTLTITNVDEGPVFSDILTGTASVNENVSGAEVYTALATDPEGDDVVYSLAAGGDNDNFTIHATTGVVTFSGPANFERDPAYAITVIATSSGKSSSHNVAVSVQDVNEAPTITSSEFGSVLPSDILSTVVYQAEADDPDGGTLSYALGSGDDNGLFEIDTGTGEVSLSSDISLTTEVSFTIQVIVSDDASPALTGSKEVAILINNRNLAPRITSSETLAIDEDISISSSIYSVVAEDSNIGDVLSFSLEGEDAALFTVNSTTGALSLNSAADYESQSRYRVLLVVTDDGDPALRDTQLLTITVNDVNEAPVISPIASATVAENASTETVVYTTTVNDPDADTTITYSLSGDDAGKFDISDSGVVTLKESANFEVQARYDITVTASDGALSASQAVTVNVTDVNEAPRFGSGTGSGTVRENAATSTVIYHADATDVDAGDAITYSVAGTDAGKVNINSSSGVVTLKNSADYETQLSYSFAVVATDNSALTASQNVTIAVTNVVDEVAPTVTIAPQGYAQVKLEAPGYSYLNDQYSSILEVNDRGEYVVSWMGYTDEGANQYRVWLQHFNNDGTTQGSPSELAPSGTIARGSAFGDTHARIARVGANGNYAVTWMDKENVSADKSSVYVQVFKQDGTKISDPYKIEDNTNSEDVDPQVAAVGYDTQFAVVYTGDVGAIETVYLQHFYSTGAPRNGIITVSSGLGKSYRPEVAQINDTGDYVVVFTGQETGGASGDFAVYYQRFSRDDAKVGGLQKFEPTGYPVGFNGRPEITGLGDDGAFAFVWHGEGASGYQNIYVRKVSSSGVLQAQIELSAKGTTLAEDELPKILNVGDGEAFVVVWEGKEGANPEADTSVYTQLFDANGNASGAMVKLEGEVGNGNDRYIQVARYGASGEYVVAWQGPDSGGDSSIYVQLFNSNGTTKGSRIKLEGDGRTDGNDYLPQITEAGGAGGFAVSWHGVDSGGDYSVFVQQFYQDGSLVQPVAVPNGATVTVRSSEIGTVYLAHEAINVTSVESITGNEFTYLWRATTVTAANADINIATGGMAGGHYNIYSVDAAGNLSAAADYGVDIQDFAVVVFDLARGISSNHSGRNFSSGVRYDIYIRVDSDGAQAPDYGADWFTWTNAENLGADDTITLVGSGGEMLGSQNGVVDSHQATGGAIQWKTSGTGRAAWLTRGGKFSRSYDGGGYIPSYQFSVDLWAGNWGANPNSGEVLNDVLMTALPAGFLTSQGLN